MELIKDKRSKPHSGASEEFVEEQKAVHRRSGPDDSFHVAAFSNESWDPSELKG